ncbi:alcohol dehydrogenase [Synergistales bacterium]|nr:alcohol dehydrogenase [Synergistales bacterium]
MEKMKALVMRAPKVYGVEQVDVPSPAPGEVLVKIKAVAICGSDPKLFRGDYVSIGWPSVWPFIPGHEFAGEVVELGKDVTAFQVGDRVAGEAHCGCGTCPNCKQGMYNLCLNYGDIASGHRHYGFLAAGAYAEYSVYNTKAIAKMPDNVSFDEGSMVDTAGTSLQSVRLAGITVGGYSLIIGPGPIGMMVMQIAKAKGARTIVVGRRERLQMAKELGADIIINYEEHKDIVAEVKRITGGFGADEAFECAGNDDAMCQCIRSVKKGGRVAFVSLPAVDEHTIPVKTMVMNQIALFGSRANPNCSETVLNLMSQGHLNAKKMVTHVFPLEEIEKAVDVFVNRRDGAMKVVLHPDA